MKELEAELRESCDTLKSNLETETLSKVDLQNHIQSLKEELAFRKKIYEEVSVGFYLMHTFKCVGCGLSRGTP